MSTVDIEQVWRDNLNQRIRTLEEKARLQQDLSDVYAERIAKARKILESFNLATCDQKIIDALWALEGK